MRVMWRGWGRGGVGGSEGGGPGGVCGGVCARERGEGGGAMTIDRTLVYIS